MKKYTLLILLYCILLTGCSQNLFQEKSTCMPLTISIPKIGKADCSILTIDDKTIMIDTGEVDSEDEIIQYLDSNNIT